MRSAAALLAATHLAPSLLVTAICATLAATAGRGPTGTAAVAGAVLAGQFSVGWGNDWVDRHRDAASGRDDKPIVAGAIPARAVLLAALGALAACVGLSLLSGWRAAAVHLLAVGLGWSYDLGVKATAASVVPYAAAFGLLPVFVTTGLPSAPLPPWWAVSAGALLGAGAHFVNALPDLDDDARTGIRGLPQRAGHERSLSAGAALLAAGAGVALLGPTVLGPGGLASTPPGPGIGVATIGDAPIIGLGAVAALAVGVVIAGRRGRERLAWTLTLLLAGAAIAALAASGAALA